VLEAEASISGRVRVEFDRGRASEAQISAALTSLRVTRSDRIASGAKADAPSSGEQKEPHAHVPGETHDHEHAAGAAHEHTHAAFLGPYTELIFALACGAALAIGFAIEKLAGGAPEWLPI